MFVIIDTNVLVTLNFFINSVKSKKLLKCCEMGLIELIVPDVVLKETLQKYHEAILRVCSSEKKLHKEKKRLLLNFGEPESLIDVEGKCKQYSDFLDSLFEQHRVKVVKAPTIPQEEVLERAIKKTRPFLRIPLIPIARSEGFRSPNPGIAITKSGDSDHYRDRVRVGAKRR